MQRVMIVGGPGAGKSTLARQLGAVTGLPVFHMDHIHWRPGWVARDHKEKTRLTEKVHAQEAWIFEGGHSATYPQRIARADTFIWLDLPIGLRLWRVFRRTALSFGRTRPDLPEGCREGFHKETLPFLAFIWRTRHSHRGKLLKVMRAPPAHLMVYRLTSLSEARRFLEGLQK